LPSQARTQQNQIKFDFFLSADSSWLLVLATDKSSAFKSNHMTINWNVHHSKLAEQSFNQFHSIAENLDPMEDVSIDKSNQIFQLEANARFIVSDPAVPCFGPPSDSAFDTVAADVHVVRPSPPLVQPFSPQALMH